MPMKNRRTLILILTTAFLCLSSPYTMAEGGIKGWFKGLFGRNTETTDTSHPDLAALTVDENLEIPEIPKKKREQVLDIQRQESQRLKGIDSYKVETLRYNEVIRITIPAAKLFAPNDTTLAPTADDVLRPLLQCLRTPDYYHMLLVMHSDDTGSEAYSLDLTRSRVQAVRDWFARNGGNTDFVVTYEAGAFSPIASNRTMEGRAKNRRLEIYLIPGEKMIDMARRGQLDKR